MVFVVGESEVSGTIYSQAISYAFFFSFNFMSQIKYRDFRAVKKKQTTFCFYGLILTG